MIRRFSVSLAAVAVFATLVLTLGAGDRGTAHAQPLPTEGAVQMVRGANLVVYGGPTTDVAVGLNTIADDVIAVWAFEAPIQTWLLWSPALPDLLQGFDQLEGGRPYFVIMSAAGLWVFPAATPLPDLPPLVFLTIGDQVFLPERGSYCWPTVGGAGICADTAFPPGVDVFASLEGGPVMLHWDPPPPDTFVVSLLGPAGEPTSFNASFEGASAEWAPAAPAGDYILQVSGVWRSLPGDQSGDGTFFFGIHLDEDGGFPTVEVEAPIQSVAKSLGDGGYLLTIEFGLPNGCHEFSSMALDESGEIPVVTVLLTAPAPEADVACTEIFRVESRDVSLGMSNPDTVVVNGDEYQV